MVPDSDFMFCEHVPAQLRGAGRSLPCCVCSVGLLEGCLQCAAAAAPCVVHAGFVFRSPHDTASPSAGALQAPPGDAGRMHRPWAAAGPNQGRVWGAGTQANPALRLLLVVLMRNAGVLVVVACRRSHHVGKSAAGRLSWVPESYLGCWGCSLLQTGRRRLGCCKGSAVAQMMGDRLMGAPQKLCTLSLECGGFRADAVALRTAAPAVCAAGCCCPRANAPEAAWLQRTPMLLLLLQRALREAAAATAIAATEVQVVGCCVERSGDHSQTDRASGCRQPVADVVEMLAAQILG